MRIEATEDQSCIPTERDPFSILSPREMEVAKALQQGLNNDQIAQLFTLSERTVRTHITNIFKKLHLVGRYELLMPLSDSPYIIPVEIPFLTPTESLVVQDVVRGNRIKTTADNADRAKATIKTHRFNILNKTRDTLYMIGYDSVDVDALSVGQLYLIAEFNTRIRADSLDTTIEDYAELL